MPALTALFFAIALPVAAQTGATIAAIPSSTGFESVSSGSHLSGSVLEGWTVSGSPVGVIDDQGGAHGGANYLALASGRISRTFATKPGAAYQLRYQARGFGLIDWWPGDNNAEDVIGGNNGTISNPAQVSYDTGKVNQGFQFSGHGNGNTGNEIDFGRTAGNFGTNNFTIDFWIKMPPTAIGQYGILEKRIECDSLKSYFDIHCGHVWSFEATTNGRLFMDFASDNIGYFTMLIGHKPINDGNFHHAAFVRNGPVATLYVDGVIDAVTRANGVAEINNNDMCRAGQSVCVGVDTSRPFPGDLDELDFFNRALSPAEIQAIYAAGSDGKYGPVSTLLPNLELSIRGVMTNNVFLDEAAGPWRQFTNNFTAAKSQVTIEFEGNPLGVLLDDIEMVPAP